MLTHRKPAKKAIAARLIPALCALVLACGCATQVVAPVVRRPFNFQKDTFAFANELVWEYHYDEHGKWVSQSRQPEPDYTHHCFVVARSSRQFFEHARFDASLPVADEKTYRRLVHRVLETDPSHAMSEAEKIVIPGYADLRSFSAAQEKMLKDECGGAWHSYVQRGHWRMIFPFSRHSQEESSQQLVADIKADRPPVIHVVRFPHMTINHAIVLFGAAETDTEIHFTAYDPNNPTAPTALTYDRATRTFNYPANDYFPGGRVDVYEVYCDWMH